MNTAVRPWLVDNAKQTPVVAPGDRQSPLRRLGAALWRGIQASDRARGHREMLALADQFEALQPQLARELRAACRQGPMV